MSYADNYDFINWVMAFHVTEEGIVAPTDGQIYYPPAVSEWLNGDNGAITELEQI